MSESAQSWRHLVTSGGPALVSIEGRSVVTGTGVVSVRVYRPLAGRLPVVIFIHGGGWWTGSASESDGTCARIAKASGCVVVSVDYRLAPEHPFPAALNDCFGVVTWVSEHGGELDVDSDRLVLVGRSSGANLAAAVTLLARARGGPHFVAQVLDVPLVDCTMSHPSIQSFSEGYFLERDDVDESIWFYLGGHDPTDPLVSPVRADLRKLPPALILTAEFDPIRDEGEAYAAKLSEAGVRVVHHRFAGITHAAADFDVLLPDVADQYLTTIARFLDTVLRQDSAFGR